MSLGGYFKVFPSTRAPAPDSSSRNRMSQKYAHILMAVLFAIIVLRRTDHTGLGSPWVAIALTTLGTRAHPLPISPQQNSFSTSLSLLLAHHSLASTLPISTWTPHGTLWVHAPTAGYPFPRNHWQIQSHQHCQCQQMGISQNLQGWYVRAPTGRHPWEQTPRETPRHQRLLSMSAHAWTLASHVAWHHFLPCRQQLWHQDDQHGRHETFHLIASRTQFRCSWLDRIPLLWGQTNMGLCQSYGRSPHARLHQ